MLYLENAKHNGVSQALMYEELDSNLSVIIYSVLSDAKIKFPYTEIDTYLINI